MQKHFGIVVGVTMIGVAAVVVSQTSLVSAPIQGQIVPGDMMNSTGFVEPQSQEAGMPVSSVMSAPADIEMSAPSSVGMENSVPSSNTGDTNEKWDCVGIREANEKMCNTLELDGTLLCSDGERDCLDACVFPWPIISFCEQACRSEKASCDYQLTKKVIACNDRTHESFMDCMKHNSSLGSSGTSASSDMDEQSSQSSEDTQGMSSSMDMQ